MATDPFEAEIRGTSDGFLLTLGEVEEREHQKRAVLPTDPTFLALARSVEEVTRELLTAAIVQVRLAERANAATAPDLAPITDVEPAADLAVILREWRDVDRALQAAEPGSDAALELTERYGRLRDRYARELARRSGESID